MRKLFDVVNEDLFSILASYKKSETKNKFVYADALFVLYKAFKTELKLGRDKLADMLEENLAAELLDGDFDGELNDEENTLSGRAKFLVRKLKSVGWIDFENGSDYNQYVILPPTSSKILKVLYELLDEGVDSTFNYVYGTFAALKDADSAVEVKERVKLIYSSINIAEKNTLELCELLTSVYHSVNIYCKQLAEIKDAGLIFSEAYDQFQPYFIKKFIEPLKLRESIPKYKTKIISYIDKWLNDNEILDEISSFAASENTSCDSGFDFIYRKLTFVKEAYQSFERNYIEPIDEKVRRYTKTTTQKLQILTESSSGIKNNLVTVLNYLSENNDEQYILNRTVNSFNLVSCNFIGESCLSKRKKVTERNKGNRLVQEDSVDYSEKIAEEIKKKQNSQYGKRNVRKYVKNLFGDRDTISIDDFAVVDDNNYLLSILSAARADDSDAFYKLKINDGQKTNFGYSAPNMIFNKKV